MITHNLDKISFCTKSNATRLERLDEAKQYLERVLTLCRKDRMVEQYYICVNNPVQAVCTLRS